MASLSLRSEDQYILHISLSRTSLAAGALIFSRDMDPVLFIEKGLVSPTIITEDGKTLGLAPIGCEGVVGLPGIGGDDYGLHVRAVTTVEALQISRQALTAACSKSKELEKILRNYSEDLINESIQLMACHYHHGLERRLPRWLLMATERARSHRLTITQPILAEAHGVGLGAINFTLQCMEKRGLIQRDRSQITVVNRGRLRSAACRCYPETKRGKKYVIKTRSL